MSRLFGKAVHAGFVVPDLQQAMQRLLASGVGPCYLMSRMRVPARYRGARHDVLISAAFAFSGGLQLEYVEQHDDTPSAYREFLERQPDGGLHHLAYFCDGFDSAFAKARASGTPLRIVQEFIGADGNAYEVYAEPEGAGHPLLLQLMVPSPLSTFFDTMEQEAAAWTGDAPIRDALALLPPVMRPATEA